MVLLTNKIILMKFLRLIFPSILMLMLLSQACNRKAEPEIAENVTAKEIKGFEIPFFNQTMVAIEPKGLDEITERKTVAGIQNQILRASMTGKIKSYLNDSLKKSYSPSEILQRGLSFSLFDDSTIAKATYKKGINNEMAVALNWEWNNKSGMGNFNVNSMASIIKPQIEGIMLKKQAFFWAGLDDMDNVVDENDRLFLDQFIDKGIIELSGASVIKKDESGFYTKRVYDSISGEGLYYDLVSQKLKNLIKTIYVTAIAGKIKGYKTEELKEAYSSDELKNLGASEQVVKVYPDEDNQEEWFDSVIINQVRPESLSGFELYEKWEKGNDGLLHYPTHLSIGMRYHKEVEGVQLKAASLFWVDYSKLQNVLSSEDLNWLNKYFYLTLQTELSGDF